MSSLKSAITDHIYVLIFMLLFTAYQFHYPFEYQDSFHEKPMTRYLMKSQSYEHTHKRLFPLNEMDIIGTIVIFFALALVSCAGIGSAGVLVPLLTLIMGFNTKRAIPISNFTVVGCAAVNIVMNACERHPELDRPLVEWSIVMVMLPMTLIGTVIGGYINKVIPGDCLDISLTLLLVLAAYRTILKWQSQYRQEGYKELSEIDMRARNSTSIGYESSKETPNESSKETPNESPVESPTEVAIQVTTAEAIDQSDIINEKSRSSTVASTEDVSLSKSESEVLKLIEEESAYPFYKVALVLLLTIGGIALNVSKAFFLCNGFWYWFVTLMELLWISVIGIYMRSMLIGEWKHKIDIGFVFHEGDIEWNEGNTAFYGGICIFAGLVAGLFGKPGIIFGPLMLEMGVNPLVTASTAAVMVMFTGLSSTSVYIVTGVLTYDYAFYVGVVGVIATLFGMFAIGHVIKKYKRVSVIALSVSVMFVIATGVMALVTYLRWGSHGDDSLCPHHN